MPRLTQYDYLILGSGCAGLSLVMRLLQHPQLRKKRVLLIDKDIQKQNDRTWCFWEEGDGFFQELVRHSWDHLDFFGEGFAHTLDISPYRYKMVRGIDFYKYCFEEMARHDHIEIYHGEIGKVSHANGIATLELDGETIALGAAQVFNSVYRQTDENSCELRLLQHFKGWVIDAAKPVFDPERATLMDFRIHQDRGTAFVYILPFSTTSALVEYTLFTKELLKEEAYELELQRYIADQLKLTSYRVRETEFGVIPMTNRRFPRFVNGVYQIGAAGGQTKPSTGYTFQFIQRHTQQVVDCLAAGRSLQHISPAARFRFYDQTFLHVLYYERLRGKDIFTALFKKNKATQVLRFLDNASTLAEELKIISTLPTLPFLRAAWKEL